VGIQILCQLSLVADDIAARAKFFNFCGQPGARLDSDQTIYPHDHERQSILFIIASILLFGAPDTHQQDLKVIWVDRIINRVLWKQFIGNLSDQWAGLALSVRLPCRKMCNEHILTTRCRQRSFSMLMSPFWRYNLCRPSPNY